MEELDALLEELEHSTFQESDDYSKAASPALDQHSRKESNLAETSKVPSIPDDTNPFPVQLVYTTKIQEPNVYSEIQEPKASPPASKTSAAAQLDELMARLCEMQHQVIHALGQAWHPEHFVCAHCKGEIGSSPFFERSGLAYCAEDYHRLFSPRCAYCAAPILDKVLTAMNQTWHPEHFFCAHCGEVFGEEGFHEKDKKPYCRKDFLGMFAPRCGGCNRPVLENYLSAMGTVWHPECFVCRVGTLPYLLRFGRGRALLSGVQLDCFSGFSTGSFFELDGRPFCELHYHRRRGTLCHGCGQPITGRCISAMGYRFHPEHFTCAFCLTQLSKGVFKEQNDKTYCHPCFNKLFPV
ncbi:leupaxin isoform X6 [Cervus canadensis]|uniref:leupaxin isoform X6 n=1 Tax=Cervus canadensis TaxID=1574408 RepID=UPI001C9E37D5|nr:leupaxin isoform X6 [Cervus canadensis]